MIANPMRKDDSYNDLMKVDTYGLKSYATFAEKSFRYTSNMKERIEVKIRVYNRFQEQLEKNSILECAPTQIHKGYTRE